MADSSRLKLDLASKRIIELSELMRKERPFTYVLETNTHARQRATYAKENEPVIANVAALCGEILHSVRSSLDHAYWDIVSPYAPAGRAESNVQFPFSETAARLEETVKNRLAHRVSEKFFHAVLDLKPHGEPGGNELLFLLERLYNVDKHRKPIPAGDYTQISGNAIRKQIPDFPAFLTGYMAFGQNGRDVVWPMSPNVPVGFHAGVLEQELDVPVDVVFAISSDATTRRVVPTLHQIVDVVGTAINTLRAARP